MLPTRRILAIPLGDLYCVVLKELSLGRFLSRAQRVERYYISTNPFTSGYERRGFILPIGLGLRAVVRQDGDSFESFCMCGKHHSYYYIG